MSKSITVRFNDDEWIALSSKIKDSGMTQSDYIRTACFNCKVVILDPKHQLYSEIIQLIDLVNEVKQTGVKVPGLKKGVRQICRLLSSLMENKTVSSS